MEESNGGELGRAGKPHTRQQGGLFFTEKSPFASPFPSLYSFSSSETEEKEEWRVGEAEVEEVGANAIDGMYTGELQKAQATIRVQHLRLSTFEKGGVKLIDQGSQT
tara:strand:- start:371 stop:691 length:321 start_codon:yes stop_codon:yes gene_type:complete